MCATVFFLSVVFACMVVWSVSNSNPEKITIGVNINCMSNSCDVFAKKNGNDYKARRHEHILLTFEKVYSVTIQPYKFQTLVLTSHTAALVNLNFQFSWYSSFAVITKQENPPTLTNFDSYNVVKGGKLQIMEMVMHDNTRNKLNEGTKHTSKIPWSHDSQVANIKIDHTIKPGKLFVTVYSDNSQSQQFNIEVTLEKSFPTSCLNDCSGQGSCYLGKCDCILGKVGVDCSQSVCPSLCSNHGIFGGGICHCKKGWKGAECDIPQDECLIPDCNGNGECENGDCNCYVGWKGEFCDEADYTNLGCLDHNMCNEDKCDCSVGWVGGNDSDISKNFDSSLPLCSDHGTYDEEKKICVCDENWTGQDCNQGICYEDCGENSVCEDGNCISKQNQSNCDPRCLKHGQCKNGTCVCSIGWEGRHCTLSTCRNGCTNHGTCAHNEENYSCSCFHGWDGIDCGIQLETVCDDGIDNDGDGLTDCYDSECCQYAACIGNINCQSSCDPNDVLLHKEPPHVTASFFNRMKFLIEEGSVQSYTNISEINERCASVVRGQVVSSFGLGVIGVRISAISNIKNAFTVTRKDGWFDMFVNGGQATRLDFSKHKFVKSRTVIYVPCNEIVLVSPTVMALQSTESKFGIKSFVQNSSTTTTLEEIKIWSINIHEPCEDHDRQNMNLDIWPSLITETIRGNTGQRMIFAETQTLQESIQIPGSNMDLIYTSSQSAGYFSTIIIKLTGSYIPDSLIYIYVQVEVEGTLRRKAFESDPNLIYTFAWNKYNIYKQKVYGFTHAKVSIGYQYSTCSSVMWDIRKVAIPGFDYEVSEIGGWNLNVHNYYDFHQGILQKSNGVKVYLRKLPLIMKTIVNNFQNILSSRNDFNTSIECGHLNNPVALTYGPDGSLYVGDSNGVKRVSPERKVYTVLEFSSQNVTHKYYMTISPDGKLYVSIDDNYQVIRVLSLHMADKFEPVVGTGEKCASMDNAFCGDNGPAKEAKLSHPKGIAFTVDGTMYLADGRNIRVIDTEGTISTIIGHPDEQASIPCQGSISARKIKLSNPTQLTINPTDDTLYFVDDHLVLKLYKDLSIKVVVGIPSNCYSNTDSSENNKWQEDFKTKKDSKLRSSVERAMILGSISSITFNSFGELFIIETIMNGRNKLHVLDSFDVIKEIAVVHKNKLQRKCQCSQNSTSKFNFDTNIDFTSISSITASHDGTLYVTDVKCSVIAELIHYTPTLNKRGEYRIPYSMTGELYIFNRFGQHIATKDLVSDRKIFSFFYNKNASNGKLVKVTDNFGNVISFRRDYSDRVETVTGSLGNECNVNLTRSGQLSRLWESGRVDICLRYDRNSGLLKSRVDSYGSKAPHVTIYNYDNHGRLTTVIFPTGEVMNLDLKFTVDDGWVVHVNTPLRTKREKSKISFINIEPKAEKKVFITEGSRRTGYTSFSNGSSSIYFPSGVHLEVKTNLLEILQQMIPVTKKQVLNMGNNITNFMQWTYKLIHDPFSKKPNIHKQLVVNKHLVLGVEYNKDKETDTFYDQDGESLLAIKYNKNGLPEQWNFTEGCDTISVTYDNYSRISSWRWGTQQEKYTYNMDGLLMEVSSPYAKTQFGYNKQNLVSQVTLPSNRTFSYVYDEDGGLRHIFLPLQNQHSFSCQPSIGFLHVTYTPPGGTEAYIQHYSYSGILLQTIFPNDGGKIVYRYHSFGFLAEVVHGDGKCQIIYCPIKGFPLTVVHRENGFHYRWEFQYIRGLLTKKHIYYKDVKLNNAKFEYEYDSNFRIISIQSFIGSQILPTQKYSYNPKTGLVQTTGSFKFLRYKKTVTASDGTSSFMWTKNMYFQDEDFSVTIGKKKVLQIKFSYDYQNRVYETIMNMRTHSGKKQKVIRKYFYDEDGQLIGVDGHDFWKFKYDGNGNQVSIIYRNKIHRFSYDEYDRIIKFDSRSFKYDEQGRVIEIDADEWFRYNSRGLLARTCKRGKYDLFFFYDHLNRLVVRNDGNGNILQFFYTNHQKPYELSYINDPQNGKIVYFTYGPDGNLIFVQVNRKKYYVASDSRGTPIMLYNEFGENVREIIRSPYGHVVFDSNPSLYIAIDFCGGIIDEVCKLVHMPNGQLYNPSIGQYMIPNLEGVFSNLKNPNQMGLYKFYGNDPINSALERKNIESYQNWLSLLGYSLSSIAPQLYLDTTLDKSVLLPPFGLHEPLYPQAIKNYKSGYNFHSILNMVPDFYAKLQEIRVGNSLVHPSLQELPFESSYCSPQNLLLKNKYPVFTFNKFGAESEPPFGKGILVSTLPAGNVVVQSMPSDNDIDHNVLTSVFNDSYCLPFTFLNSAQQDVFYFMKEGIQKSSEDAVQLKRLSGQFKTTFHVSDGIASVASNGSNKAIDIKIQGSRSKIYLQYCNKYNDEKERLLHHAKNIAIRKAWIKEKENIQNVLSDMTDWTESEVDDIVKKGYSSNYIARYIHNVYEYPELSGDKFNIKFVRKPMNTVKNTATESMNSPIPKSQTEHFFNMHFHNGDDSKAVNSQTTYIVSVEDPNITHVTADDSQHI